MRKKTVRKMMQAVMLAGGLVITGCMAVSVKAEENSVSVNACREMEDIGADTATASGYDLDGNLHWSITGSELVITGTGSGDGLDYADKDWLDYAVAIKTAKVSVTDVASMSGWFSELSNLSSIDFSGTDTSNVTDMYGLFNGCEKLESIDVSNFNTSQVTDMSNMFSGCSRLKSISLSGFDTSQVEKMDAMFYGCSSLTKVYPLSRTL